MPLYQRKKLDGIATFRSGRDPQKCVNLKSNLQYDSVSSSKSEVNYHYAIDSGSTTVIYCGSNCQRLSVCGTFLPSVKYFERKAALSLRVRAVSRALANADTLLNRWRGSFASAFCRTLSTSAESAGTRSLN